jgi:type I restriction enzyme S subunit
MTQALPKEVPQTLRRWKHYPAYKDSGVEWLGEIPKDWEVLHLRRVIRSFVDYRGATPEKVPDGIPLITARNIKNGVIDFSLSQEYIREEDYASWMVRGFPEAGDVLVTTEAPLGESAQILEENIALAQRIILLKAEKSRINNDYLKYYIASTAGKGELWSRATGSTAIGIKASHLRETLITVPPSISEQKAIASFLDRETAKIDALIAKKERLIELLQEKRTAIISHAVTKGLDPTAPLKDSGVEWLGEIPAHWEVKRLKFLTSLVTSGSRGWAQYYSDDGAIFLRIGNLSRTSIELDFQDIQYVSPPRGTEGERTQVQQNDVLLSITAYIGSVAVVTEDIGEAYVNQHIALTRPRKEVINSRWLAYCLMSQIGQAQFGLLLYGGTKDGLGLGDVSNLYAFVTPLAEQIAVVEFINRETAKIDALIAKIREGIEKLKEYRTALISAAVTGKIDVRNEVAL